MPANYSNFIEFIRRSKNKGEVIPRIASLSLISAAMAAIIHLVLDAADIFSDPDPIFTVIILVMGYFALFGVYIFPLVFAIFLAYGFIANLLPIIEKSWLCIAFVSITIAVMECFMWYLVIQNNWPVVGLSLKIELNVFLQYYFKYERIIIFTAANFLPRLFIPKLRPGKFLLKHDVHPPPIPDSK